MVSLRIPVLTDEMRATFPAFVDEWTAIGRSTQPVDRPAAVNAVNAAYAAAGLAPPVVFFAVSPVGGVLMRRLLCDRLPGVWAGVRDGMGDGVGAGVRDGVWDGVRAGVWAGVGAGVRAGVGAYYSDIFYGCHDAAWLAFYDWFRRHHCRDICAPLDGLTTLAKSAGWTWLHRGFCVVSDRPATLHDEHVPGTNHQRRLHNPDGPSVTYRDGWSTHHWHGQLVPPWVIEDPTIDRIKSEPNTEVRRCAIEACGWGSYLDQLGVQPVDVAPDPGNPGRRLRLFDLPADTQPFTTPVRLLVMDNASLDRDGTRRTFAETVPVDMPDAVTAAAWQFDTDPTVYRAIQRAT
jgi:hypothetical protein